jgi:hypothetical protein
VSDVLADAISARWDEYTRFERENAMFSACVRLGEITNCLRYSRLSRNVASKWESALENVQISPALVQVIRREAQSRIERLQRILGAGDRPLIYEEMLLVITFRTELEIVSEYLVQNDIGSLPDVDWLDEELLRLSSAPRTSAVYLRAQEAARRNWGLPLHVRWLGGETMP